MVVRVLPSAPRRESHNTGYMASLLRECHIAACFRPKMVHINMNSMNKGSSRGHWRLLLPRTWPAELVDRMWHFLEACVEQGRAGNATWLERSGEEQNVEESRDKSQSPNSDQGRVEVWKLHDQWRLCLAHWSLLYVGSNGLIKSRAERISYHDQVNGLALIDM